MGVTLRRATVFDVFDLSRVLIRSITQLCVADHQNDPQAIEQWVADKDPATIRGWIIDGAGIWLAEHAGQTAAVGGLRGAEITLLYIDPDHGGHGIGAALLNRLEQEVIASGHSEARLEATRTAQAFYERYGWQLTGRCGARGDVSCFGMRKSLQPTD
ncbi:GNAT family N-acetyltransferase [Ruegeria atlantica]|uniref:GNAT family N-acetyltransferase n=1 Tax=Ruegeria atlantica TaxID=81569 RepID=UPI0014819854|nr:GNAT family N-acetyltransferase [Ruegeria atlantica]